jgi:hypothetical protein
MPRPTFPRKTSSVDPVEINENAGSSDSSHDVLWQQSIERD